MPDSFVESQMNSEKGGEARKPGQETGPGNQARKQARKPGQSARPRMSCLIMNFLSVFWNPNVSKTQNWGLGRDQVVSRTNWIVVEGVGVGVKDLSRMARVIDLPGMFAKVGKCA